MNNGQAMVTTTTEGFGSRSLAHSSETHTSALTAQATAAVNARFIMALQHPRSWDDARARLIQECKRPGFAAAARYKKPQGKDRNGKPQFIEGASIRFAEACLRNSRNLDVSTATLVDDPEKRILQVEAKDLETNVGFSQTITIAKTVERKAAAGRLVISERTNSYGDRVFIVEATDDELMNKINSAVSKAARTLILRLIPSDIVDDALAVAAKTLADGVKADPAAAKKGLVDAFADLRVMPRDLEAYLGHDLATVSPNELEELRGIYAAIRDGEMSWADVANQRTAEGDAPADATPKKASSALADQIRKNKKGRAEAAPPESKPAEPESPKPDEATAPTEPAPEAPAKELTDEEKAALIDAGVES